MPDLEHVVRKKIRRVVADPADIDRYTVEFYSLARSIVGATGTDRQVASGVTNLETMLELGKITDPDANVPGKTQYDRRTSERAFRAMHNLLAEVFQR